MIQYDQMKFDYEPYPIGIARPALEPDFYRALVESFPPAKLFEYKAEKGGKYSLSQVNHAAEYARFIKSSAPWQKFYDYIKSKNFVDEALAMLKKHEIDLGFPSPRPLDQIYLKMRALKRGNPVPHFAKLKSRFEFSAMPSTGGNIIPHTDHPKKIITMVIPMLHDDEWNDAWGGGTTVVWPKDNKKIFNRMNNYLDFDKVRKLNTYPFEANQCLVFIKTSNSWHAVLPMTGKDPKILRKTLTINIESS
jgi:hypothetical protein